MWSNCPTSASSPLTSYLQLAIALIKGEPSCSRARLRWSQIPRSSRLAWSQFDTYHESMIPPIAETQVKYRHERTDHSIHITVRVFCVLPPRFNMLHKPVLCTKFVRDNRMLSSDYRFYTSLMFETLRFEFGEVRVPQIRAILEMAHPIFQKLGTPGATAG
nr:hypothetical protein CFP56_62766 [Quercus suber]